VRPSETPWTCSIGVDDDDLRLLGRRIGIATVDEAFETVERYYRRRRISAKAGFFMQAMFPGDGTFVSEESSD
jgi:hypothetical protein